jgi:RNA polymerase sigma factor (sigma-70 family)
MDEQELIIAVKKGDEVAFKQLIALYKNKVYNTVLHLLQNVEDAQDLAQEVFVEIFLSIQTFEGKSSLYTWIYRVAVSKALDFIRKKKRKKRFGVFYSLFKEESSEPRFEQATFHHPAVDLENQERTSILYKAIEQLPENQKVAFILHKIEDLSYEEVSKVMEVSLSSVESLLFRAKQNLKKLLKGYYQQDFG